MQYNNQRNLYQQQRQQQQQQQPYPMQFMMAMPPGFHHLGGGGAIAFPGVGGSQPQMVNAFGQPQGFLVAQIPGQASYGGAPRYSQQQQQYQQQRYQGGSGAGR